MKNIESFSKVFFTELGFRGSSDYFATVFGLKGMGLTIWMQWAVAFALAAVSFIEQWVWPKPLAFGALLGCVILDARYGYLVARKHGKSFELSKFWRTISIVTAHIAQLMVLNALSRDYDYEAVTYFCEAVFFGLFFYKFDSVTGHMKQLGLCKNSASELIRKAATGSLSRITGAPKEAVEAMAAPKPEPGEEAVK